MCLIKYHIGMIFNQTKPNTTKNESKISNMVANMIFNQALLVARQSSNNFFYESVSKFILAFLILKR